MTMGEAIREADGIQWRTNEERKVAARFAYAEAMTTGAFVSAIFGGSRPPEIYDVFPELFSREDDEAARMEKSANNFIKFANAHNRKCED